MQLISGQHYISYCWKNMFKLLNKTLVRKKKIAKRPKRSKFGSGTKCPNVLLGDGACKLHVYAFHIKPSSIYILYKEVEEHSGPGDAIQCRRNKNWRIVSASIPWPLKLDSLVGDVPLLICCIVQLLISCCPSSGEVYQISFLKYHGWVYN